VRSGSVLATVAMSIGTRARASITPRISTTSPGATRTEATTGAGDRGITSDRSAAATVRDQARKKTAGLEDERAELQKDLEDKGKQLQLVTKERDELRLGIEHALEQLSATE